MSKDIVPIQLKNVVFSWVPGQPVLDIPELTINHGESVFIKGPSGSGKTTLLGLLGGVLTPDQGTVSLLGSALEQLSPAKRDHFRASHIGFIFQMFNLIPYLSVVENVVLPASFDSARQQRIEKDGRTVREEAIRLLNHLGLKDERLLARSVTELSIGQQQRVAAARALLGRPEIIIADEPTSALDADSRIAFLELLFAECKTAGSTLIFVSHDPALERLFDRSISLGEINQAAISAEEATA